MGAEARQGRLRQTLPTGYQRQGFTLSEAATFVGARDTATFLAMVRQGVFPPALAGYPADHPTWDVKALRAALDRLSGLVEPSQADLSEVARRRIHEGRGEVRHLPPKR